MDKVQDKPTWSKKRILEPQVEGGSKKERKRLKKVKTEPGAETESETTRINKITEFKSQGQKLTEKEKSKKTLLRKLQKMRKSEERPTSKPTTTTERIERKEVKTGLLAAPVIEDKTCESGKSSLKPQEVGIKTGESKKKKSPADRCVNKEDAEWYQGNVNEALDQLMKDLLHDEDKKLYALIERFMFEVRRSMQCIELQPGIELAEIRDIVDTIADKDGTVLKSFLKGELVLNKEVWQKLIDLKFGITVNRDEQITKQLEEGMYMRNAKSPGEESYLKGKIAYIFKHGSKAQEHNAKVAEGLADLAQQMDSLNDFYVVAQAATANRIIINSPSIDRLLTEQKNNKSKQDQLLQEHQTSKAVEETCLPLMKEEWIDRSFKPM